MIQGSRLQLHSPGKKRSVVHRAGWILVDPWTVIRDGFLVSENGMIRDIGHGKIDDSITVIDHGPGVLMPALVNAHTHLELCALKGCLPFDRGFRQWVRALIQKRSELAPRTLSEAVENGIHELVNTGCAVIGEVSTTGISLDPVAGSMLNGVWFRECIGMTMAADALMEEPCQDDLIISVAGHAPHSTAPDVLTAAKAVTRRRGAVFSIHLDESGDEREFITTGKGHWAEFLTERGIDYKQWHLPAKSPVEYANRLGLLDEKTLVVHLTQSERKDFNTLLEHGARVCLCMRSNMNLYGRLPDLEGMFQAGLKPSLGTDSLASNDSLSMFDEMRYVSTAFPGIDPRQILAMATVYGALALGMDDRFGTLTPAKRAVFVYAPVEESHNEKQIIEAIVK